LIRKTDAWGQVCPSPNVQFAIHGQWSAPSALVAGVNLNKNETTHGQAVPKMRHQRKVPVPHLILHTFN
jgi:hypothetical protein